METSSITTAIDPDKAVSAFFESREAAERAEAALKKAGFTDEVMYIVPRAPGMTVTVIDGSRLEQAANIMRDHGGELREADINASGSVMFRLAPSQISPDHSPAEDRASSRSQQDDDEGAGAATGGALF